MQKSNLLSLLAFGASSLHASERPNIIFFIVDDMGWMDVGYNVSEFYYTPTIDSIASSG